MTAARTRRVWMTALISAVLGAAIFGFASTTTESSLATVGSPSPASPQLASGEESGVGQGAEYSVAALRVPGDDLGVGDVSAAGGAAGSSTDFAGGSLEARLARGLQPLNVLVLPEQSLGALVVGTEDNHMLRVDSAGTSNRVEVSSEIYVAIGKAGAFKVVEGDEKTPIGVYWVRDYIPGRKLPEIYGVGAYPISYPNLWDRRVGRTGSGIWIHGTNKSDDELLPRSSRGCLTLRNQDFSALDELVRIGKTPVVITDHIRWVSPAEFRSARNALLDAVAQWRVDWESLETERYLSHYADDFRAEGMDLARWSAHKRRVNAQKKRIEVELSELSAFVYPGEEDLYLVTFRQDYRSDNFDSTRYKSQYWRHAPEGWRIVQEGGI